MRAELFSDITHDLGEGINWDPSSQTLYWIDITRALLFGKKLPSGKIQSYSLPGMIGCMVTRKSGGLILALQNGIHAFDPKTQSLEAWIDPEAHLPENRFNDGKCDPAGRLWAGTMSTRGTEGAGSLYRIDSDRSLSKQLDQVTISNGLCWDMNRECMYYIDSPTRRVDRFDYDVLTGSIQNRKSVIRLPESRGIPDGMTIDAKGNLWIAEWGGGCVSCWDPDHSQLLQTIEVPAHRVTCCCFGGRELDTLFITTAREGAPEDELQRFPLAGAVFSCQPDVRGVAADSFKG